MNTTQAEALKIARDTLAYILEFPIADKARMAGQKALAALATVSSEAQPVSVQPSTPSSRWAANGEPDPHGDSYDCERASLALGKMTDDELANAAFMHYDIRPPLQDIIDCKAFMPIVYMTAVKERIRWLSRSLEKALSTQSVQPISSDAQPVCKLEVVTYGTPVLVEGQANHALASIRGAALIAAGISITSREWLFTDESGTHLDDNTPLADVKATRLFLSLPAGIAASPAPDVRPIDMILHCPKCGLQHVDAPEKASIRGGYGADIIHTHAWDNPPHRSHLCHGCGHIWRLADVPTNGVSAIQTKGKADSLAPDVRPSVPAPQMLTFDNGMQLPIIRDGDGFKIHPDYLKVSMTDDTKTLAAYRTLIHTHHTEPDGSEFGFCRVKFDERGQLVSALWAYHEEIEAAVAALLSTQPASVPAQDSESTSEFDKGWLAGLAAATGPEMESPSVPGASELTDEQISEVTQEIYLSDFPSSAEYDIAIVRAAIAAPAVQAPQEQSYLHWCQTLIKALKRLSLAAQTTGGTAGPDAELQAAIAEAERAMSPGACSAAIDKAEAVQPQEPSKWTVTHNGKSVTSDSLTRAMRAAQALRTDEEAVLAAENLLRAIDEELAQEAAPSAPSVPAVAGQEPAEYQRRMRPTWRADGEGWTEWERCSKGSYDDVLRLKIYKDWQYEARALYAAPSASAPIGLETGWLVENGKQGDELRYRTMESGLPEWTADPNKAIRFARRIDAEWFAQEDEDAWTIVQHAWHDMAASAPSVGDVEDARRWRAFLGSARIRLLGYAGFNEGHPHQDHYRHVGMEIWTRYGAPGEYDFNGTNAIARAILTKYADAAIAAQAAGSGAK